MAGHIGRALERMGLLAHDAESAWLDLPPIEDTDAMGQLIGSSVTYRIALGPQAGRRALVLRTITPLAGEDPENERVSKAQGFSLHAGVSCEAHQRAVRELLCRYIARSAVASTRLTVTAQGRWRGACHSEHRGAGADRAGPGVRAVERREERSLARHVLPHPERFDRWDPDS